MPRYFFHLHQGSHAEDPEGVELPSVDAAYAEALRSAHSLACKSLQEKGRLVLHHSIEVQNEQRETLFFVQFGEAVEVVL